MTEHLSDLQLDAHRLGRGDDGVSSHLLACEACRAREVLLSEQAEAFGRRYDPAQLAAATLEKATPQVRAGRFRIPAVLLAAAAALVLFLRLEPEGVRKKGDDRWLRIHQRGPSGPVALEGPISAGAKLLLELRPEGPRWVRLFSASGEGPLVALYPEAEGPAWRLEGPDWLDREVVVDDAPGPERLTAVACEGNFGHTEALTMLRTRVRDDCVVEKVVLEKR